MSEKNIVVHARPGVRGWNSLVQYKYNIKLTVFILLKVARTVGLQQRAPPNAQQRKWDIRFDENLDNHSSDNMNNSLMKVVHN